MNTFNDRELFRVRLRLLDVSKSFFMEEPDAEKMSRWRGFFTALLKEQINPYLDGAIRELCSHFNEKSLEQLKEEYYQLFIDPYDRDRIQLDASYHMDGRSYGMTLAEIRGYLQQHKLEKKSSSTEPEDSLVVILDVLATLIEEEKKGNAETREAQATLMKNYLEPFTNQLIDIFTENPTADFYESCIKFLRGYLDLEKGLVGLVHA